MGVKPPEAKSCYVPTEAIKICQFSVFFRLFCKPLISTVKISLNRGTTPKRGCVYDVAELQRGAEADRWLDHLRFFEDDKGSKFIPHRNGVAVAKIPTGTPFRPFTPLELALNTRQHDGSPFTSVLTIFATDHVSN